MADTMLVSLFAADEVAAGGGEVEVRKYFGVCTASTWCSESDEIECREEERERLAIVDAARPVKSSSAKCLGRGYGP